MSDLLPCPFCGCKPQTRVDDYINGRIIADPMFYITCENPDCGVWPEAEGKYNTEYQQIVDVWNRRADTVQAQIDAAVKAERAAASEYCWQRYQNREPMNLTSPAVFTSHSHQDIVEHMERAATIRKGEQP